MPAQPLPGRNLKFSPYWWDEAPRESDPPAALPGEADVVVIGSGFTGLSCALTLARAGRAVLVLDAGVPGYGASTRNGGQVGSGNQKFRVAKLIDCFGAERAHALLRDGVAMLEYIADLITGEKIDCHFVRCGRFRGCSRAQHYEVMARDLDDLHRFAGVEYFMVPRAEQHTEVGSDAFHGGGVLPNDAAVQPAMYHSGLLARVRAAGAIVLGGTRVTALHRETGRIRIFTRRGEIAAGEVVVASNGYTTSATPRFHARIVSPGSAVIATEPLPPGLMDRLLPRRRVMGETRRVFNYYRASPDGQRMIFGGRMSHIWRDDREAAYRHLATDMRRLFPELAEVAITHAWSGRLGYTVDEFPHLGGADRIWFALGYCGTGVSRSTWFGHKLALKMLGDADGRTAFDDLDFRAFAVPFAARLAPPIVEAVYRLQDRLGL